MLKKIISKANPTDSNTVNVQPSNSSIVEPSLRTEHAESTSLRMNFEEENVIEIVNTNFGNDHPSNSSIVEPSSRTEFMESTSSVNSNFGSGYSWIGDIKVVVAIGKRHA